MTFVLIPQRSSCWPLGFGQWTSILCGWEWICKFLPRQFFDQIKCAKLFPPLFWKHFVVLDLQHDERWSRRVLCISGKGTWTSDKHRSSASLCFPPPLFESLLVLFDREDPWTRLDGRSRMSSLSPSSTKRKKLLAWRHFLTETTENHSMKMTNR